jgi:hypothetical protein
MVFPCELSRIISIQNEDGMGKKPDTPITGIGGACQRGPGTDAVFEYQLSLDASSNPEPHRTVPPCPIEVCGKMVYPLDSPQALFAISTDLTEIIPADALLLATIMRRIGADDASRANLMFFLCRSAELS